jgi:hypothetical protein
LSKFKGSGIPKLSLYQRAEEAWSYLVENDNVFLSGEQGERPTKRAFAYIMADRYKREDWLLGDGTGNAQLVTEICRLTRKQDEDPFAASIFAGFVIAYGTIQGGIVLIDPEGDLSPVAAIAVLSGDVLQQQAAKTVNRSRVKIWNALGHQMQKRNQPELARICFQAEREIDRSGFIPDDLVQDFLRLVGHLEGGEAA